MAAKNKDAWAWMTKAQVAEVTNYSVRNFTERIQPRLESSAMRGKGATLRFDVRAVGRALTAYIAEQNRPKPEQVDPLLGGDGDAPTDALEAYRREATKEKRLKNAQTERQLVDRIDLLDACSTGFAAAATISKKMNQRFGADGVAMWNEGIDVVRDSILNALRGPNERGTESGGNQPGHRDLRPTEGPRVSTDLPVRRGRTQDSGRPS